MRLDSELDQFLKNQLAQFPCPSDPDDSVAHQVRYLAASRALPASDAPVAVGDFSLSLGKQAGLASRSVSARLYRPVEIRQPVLMAFFTGGGWVHGNLDTHDALCRQLSHDLGVAIVAIALSTQPGSAPLQVCDDAFYALNTILSGRTKLGVNTQRLVVGGDGSGAHLAIQAAWRINRLTPGAVDSALLLYPLVRPDLNTLSYRQYRNALAFSRQDAARAWQGLLNSRLDTWDERAVLLHAITPVQDPPTVVVVAAQTDGAHDDAIALFDWLRYSGARCELLDAPGMTHDFFRLQHVSKQAREMVLDALVVFGDMARLSDNPNWQVNMNINTSSASKLSKRSGLTSLF